MLPSQKFAALMRPVLTIDQKEIAGYVDPWVASPGDSVDVKISSTQNECQYRLVRLLQGLTPDVQGAPSAHREVIGNGPEGKFRGRFQAAYPGSYAEVNKWAKERPLSGITGLNVSFYAQPWMLECSFFQSMISTLDPDAHTGFSIGLAKDGSLSLWVGTGTSLEEVTITNTLRDRRWAHVDITLREQHVHVKVKHLSDVLEPAPALVDFTHELPAPTALDSAVPLLFGACKTVNSSVPRVPTSYFYSGRLDSPTFTALGDRCFTIAKYDFGQGISTDRIIDVSGSGFDGVLVNSPTRAVRGYDYDHKSIGTDWTTAPYGYGAIHFHEDDLDDAAWETDFNAILPTDLRSGAYAFEVWDPSSPDVRDDVVFFVRPGPKRPQAKTAFVFSTFTYLAYANEHMYDETKSTHISFPEGVQLLGSDNFDRMFRRTDLGLAIYDLHSDGSGVVYSTAKRPVLNMRPDYVHWGFQRPREFSADLLMVGFLERLLGDGYDVLTDHDLHLRGVQALSTYDVVIAGSHPEYPSLESLDAYENFAKLGGSLMYTGGNGFYWKSVTDPSRPHRMEVRRADVGARTHENPAGERYHSLNGQLGGLWRSLGRAPNHIFGIGSCASGKGPGRPFLPVSQALQDPAFSWVWKGLSETSKQRLGENGVGLSGGASGDELDRMEFAIGTPSNAVLLARSERHDDHFMLFNEELIFPMIGTLGSTSAMVRSDMVYYETRGGGAVFSVGSINWNNSLAWNDYSNDIAIVTENVIRRFLDFKSCQSNAARH